MSATPVSGSTLQNGVVGISYPGQAFVFTAPLPLIITSVNYINLPPGLAFSVDSGIGTDTVNASLINMPTDASGSPYAGSVVVTYNDTTSSVYDYTIVINEPFVLSLPPGSTLPTNNAGSTYSYIINVVSYAGTITSVTGTGLPVDFTVGYSLTVDGCNILIGTSTPITVVSTNIISLTIETATISQTYTPYFLNLQIQFSALPISGTILSTGVVGISYPSTIITITPAALVTIGSINVSGLPTGLTATPVIGTGVITITGTPTGTQSLPIEYTVAIQVTSILLPTTIVEFDYDLTILPTFQLTPPSGINPVSLPSGYVSVFYSTTIGIESNAGDLIGYAPPILPSGLTSDIIPVSGNLFNLVIEGTPLLVESVDFNVVLDGELADATYGPYTIDIQVLCVGSGAQVLMADGTTKLIQDMKRGDLVASDPEISHVHRVAKVHQRSYQPDAIIDLYQFETGSLGEIPTKPLILTPHHAIYHEGARYPAKAFHKTNGVNLIEKTSVREILVGITHDDETVSYDLWDLQFETIGSYVVNGVTVQSRHPQSINTPLDLADYFDISFYSPTLRDDHDDAYSLPLLYQLHKN